MEMNGARGGLNRPDSAKDSIVRPVVAVDRVSRLDQQFPESGESHIAMYVGLKVGLNALHAASDLLRMIGNPLSRDGCRKILMGGAVDGLQFGVEFVNVVHGAYFLHGGVCRFRPPARLQACQQMVASHVVAGRMPDRKLLRLESHKWQQRVLDSGPAPTAIAFGPMQHERERLQDSQSRLDGDNLLPSRRHGRLRRDGRKNHCIQLCARHEPDRNCVHGLPFSWGRLIFPICTG